LVTTSEGFSKIELLLDEDTISGFESFITLLWLLDWRSLLLRGISCWVSCWGILGRILRWVLRRILLRRILLRRILLRRVLLRRVLLGRVLLRWVLLRITAELDLDSLGLRLGLHCS